MLVGLLVSIVASDILRINTYYSMPIGEEYFAVDNDNISYFLDVKERQIIVYDALGNQIHQFGQPGQGIGDLATPRRMYLEGEQLTVLEDQYINIFKKTGEFVSKDRTPWSSQTFALKFGNTLVTYRSKLKEPDQLKLNFSNLENVLYEEFISFDWEHPLFRKGMDPSMSAINIVPAFSNGFIYVVFSKKFRVVIIDVAKRAVVKEININFSPIIFDEEWGEAEYKKDTKQWQQMRRRMGLQPTGKPRKTKAFPSHFPIVRAAYPDLKGNVIVSLWTEKPDHHYNMKGFNSRGEPVAVEFHHPDTYRRLVARRNGFAYLWDYNMEDEESYIVRVKEEDVNEFAKKNPLIFEMVGQHLSKSY
jgi:hypothetical protein